MTELHPQLKAMLEDVATANYPDQIEVPIIEARRIIVQHGQQCRCDIDAMKRRTPGGHLIHHGAQTEQIAAGIDRQSSGLF